MRILGNGNVGIGTATPAAPLTVGAAVGSPATNANAVIINAANTTLSSRGGNLQVITTNTSAIDTGGSIGLGGQYNTLANSVEFASIAGRKENSTVTNFAGYLQFITTADAVAPTEKMRITSTGNVGIGTTTPSTQLHIVSAGSSNAAARVSNGFYGGQMLVNTVGFEVSSIDIGTPLVISSNTELARFAATTGNLLIGGTTDGNYRLNVQKSGSSGTFRAYDQTASTGSTLAVFRAGVAQSGNVLEVQNNAGANVLSITATGALTSAVSIVAGGNITAGTTQDLSWSTRSTMTSPSNGVIALYNNAQNDFSRLQWGGTTSSFPSIKRNGTALVIRLADDSANAAIQASSYISNDGSSGVTGPTCSAWKNGICTAL